MSKQLLFYEEAVPVSSERHRDWSLEASGDYSFASDSNSVPLVAREFGAAMAEYGIVFLVSEDNAQPVAILGLKPQQNLFVNNGQWQAQYLPAFVRRYPFVFAKDEEGERLTLCIDEKYTGWNQEGRGDPLFNEEGERSAYLDQALNFGQSFQREFEVTRQFCDEMREHDLLQPMEARVKLNGGGTAELSGFHVIDREKLIALPAKTLKALMKSDAMELIYLHLHSLGNINHLGRRFRPQ